MQGLRLGIISVFIFGFISCFTAFAQPHISSISPTAGPVSPVGSPITITGAGFGASPDTVTVGGVAAVPSSWSDTRIVAPVPSTLLPGFSDVIVTVSGVASNAQSFLVIPTITAVSPATAAPIGGMVTVTGTSFGSAPGAITFNGTPAVPSTWSNTSVTFPIPSGATSGDIVVTSNGWDTNGVNYFVSPTISSLSPASGSTGTSLTINGNGFGTAWNFNPITIGGISVTPITFSDTAIAVSVPPDVPAGNASVVVTINGVGSSTATFLLTPSITSLSASSGAIGDSITITGTSFGATPGAITFNGLPAVPSSWTDTSIVVPVPAGATSGPVLITVNGAASNSLNFTVISQPIISLLNPFTGGIGSTVVISGSHFGETQGASSVTFNGSAATVLTWSDTAISVLVRPSTMSGNVVVTVGSQTSNAVGFTVSGILSGTVAPTLTHVNLTSPVAIDWAHWGTTDDERLIADVNATPNISDFAVIGPNAPVRFSDGEIEYNWSDGNLVATADRTTTGVSVAGVGNGFHLSVAADLTPRTLFLYVGGWEAQGELTASLSDNSAATFSDNSVDIVAPNGDHHVNRTYTLTFQALQPGQTLNIDYVLTTDHGAASGLAGYVSLQSAVLMPAQPQLLLTSPNDGQTFVYPADVQLSASASQLGAPISKVSFFSDSQDIFDATSSPYAFALGGLAAGDHLITATATDANGLSTTSSPVLISEVGSGGVLTSSVDSAVSVDLSIGASDWVHWGDSVPERKGGINPQISDFKTLANGSAHAYDASSLDGARYSWSAGVPTDSQAGTATQMRMQGYKNGFSFTVPADTTLRTLKVYMASGFGEATVRASLSDGSAAPLVNAYSTPTAFNERVFTIQFQAASAGQKLTITGQVTRDDGFAYVALESASVSDQNTPQIDSITPATAAPGAQITITGIGFGAAQPSSTVSLNGVAMNVLAWSDTAITATVPLVQSGPTVVSCGLANSNGVDFTVILPPAPVISFLSPPAGTAATVVNISGSNFGVAQNGSTITFNGLAASPTSWSDTAIVVPAPAGVHSGPVIVTTASGASNPVQFTLAPGIRFSLQSAYITPDEANLEVGGSITFMLTDPSGTSAPDATWSADNSDLATISSDPASPGTATLQALAPGEVTINVNSSVGEAQALATIYAAGTTPAGTPAWSFYPQTQDNFFEVVVKSRSNSPTDPFMYFPEGTDDFPRVSALDEAGHLQWRVTLNPITPTNTIIFPVVAPATNDGGILVETNEADPNGPAEATGFYRLGPDGKPLWTYSVPTVDTSGPAIGPDGTIYFWEETDTDISLIALDDSTGIGKPIFSPNAGGAAPVFISAEQPGSINPDGTAVSSTNPWKPCKDFFAPGQFDPPNPGNGGSFTFQPVIGADGSVYVLESGESSTFTYDDCQIEKIGTDPVTNDPIYIITSMKGQLAYTRTLQLARVNATGFVTNTQLAATSYSGQADFSASGFISNWILGNGTAQLPIVDFDKVVPNADGGALVTWGQRSSTLNDPFHAFMTNVVDDSPVSTAALPFNGEVGSFGGFGDMATNNQGMVFFNGSTNVTTIDIASGNPLWSVPGSLIAATPDNGALVNSGGSLVAVDQNGIPGSDSIPVGRVSYLSPGKFYQYASFGSVQVLETDSSQLTSSLADPWPVASTADPQQDYRATGFAVKKRIIFDDPAQNPQDVPLVGIANSRTSTVVVNLAVGNKPVTLTLSSSGTGKAVFDDGTAQGKTTFTVPANTKQQILKIKGLAASQKADDVTLAASTMEGTAMGSQKFSVVSVAIAIRASGGTTVSPNDMRNDAFAVDTGQPAGTPAKLGPIIIPADNPNHGCSEAAEFVGTVLPVDYKGKVTLRREILSRVKYNTQDQPIDSAPPPSEDTSLSELLTMDVRPDGTVYDLDAPGPKPPILGIQRYRGNFREYAELGEWKTGDPLSGPEQASQDLFWFARLSCQGNGRSYSFEKFYQDDGDNSIGGSSGQKVNGMNCTPTTVDLTGSCN